MKDKKSELSSRKGISNILSPTNKENIKKSNLNFTFNKNESVSPKRLFNVNMKKTKSRDSTFKNNNCNKETININNSSSPIQNDNFGSLKSESFAYIHKSTEKIKKDNSSKGFITLKNINSSFSKQIRKKMKKRKKIQRLKKLLKLQRLKVKKNTNKKSKKNIGANDNIKENNFNYSINSTNNKILSQISDLTEEDNSSSIINIRNFHQDSLKIELSESFGIKSSYRNINLLTKGEMIQNLNYKKFIENLIEKQYNKYKINDNNYKQEISFNSNAI